MSELEDQRWRLTSVTDAGGTSVPVPDGVGASARFVDGRVSGQGGVNHWFGSYQAGQDGSLRIGEVGATLMAGVGPGAAVERALLQALTHVTRWESDGEVLVLRDAAGTDVMTFVAWGEPPVVGTRWTASGINNGHGGVQGLVAGTEVTATFGRDGVVAGATGVNRFHGGYTLDGTALAVGALVTTRMAGSQDSMAQEQAFLDAMGRAGTATVDGDALELRDHDGALQVSFVRAD